MTCIFKLNFNWNHESQSENKESRLLQNINIQKIMGFSRMIVYLNVPQSVLTANSTYLMLVTDN